MDILDSVNESIKLKENLHEAENRIEYLTEELEATKNILTRNEQLEMKLNEELENIRKAFRETCEELQERQKILQNYKQVCSQLSNQIDEHKEKYIEKIRFVHNNCCKSCRSIISFPSSNEISGIDNETLNNDNEDDLPSIIPSDVADRLHRIEMELAEKKSALAQALFENQELTTQLYRSISTTTTDSDTISLSSIHSINQNSKGSWLSKSVNSFKKATRSKNRTKTN